MGRLIYNIFMPLVFIFFLPHLISKYRSRGGWKSTFGERFGRFGSRKEELSKFRGAVWIHAVSVGETIVALSLIRIYSEKYPDRKFILSTTTTTGQDVARKQAPGNTAVIFCPLDFTWMVRRTLKLFSPSLLVIFETEIWPNLVAISKQRGIPVALVNGRLSDHSASGYSKLKCFFAPLLEKFDLIMAQSEADAKRFLAVSPGANVCNGGNMKFDQQLPVLPECNEVKRFLGTDEEEIQVIFAASTHPGEEKLFAECFKELKEEFPALKLVIVPRHAERGEDIARILEDEKLSFVRKSLNVPPEEPVDVLLADTTGEMVKLMKDADIVIVGKSFAGQDEGHNLIEPALLSKAIVTGTVLRNFRRLLELLLENSAVLTAADSELTGILRRLLSEPEWRKQLGERAAGVIGKNSGATMVAVEKLEALIRS